MERVRQEDKEEVAIFLKKYNKINSKFMKTKFISNNGFVAQRFKR